MEDVYESTCRLLISCYLTDHERDTEALDSLIVKWEMQVKKGFGGELLFLEVESP